MVAESAKGHGGRRATVKRKATVSATFAASLQNLMLAVRETDPHFIRCIKTNPQKAPGIFDRQYVEDQLRTGGVLQAVEVGRAGYPVRLPPDECWNSFRHLVDSEPFEGLPSRD